jgi:hypothetical protein
MRMARQPQLHLPVREPGHRSRGYHRRITTVIGIAVTLGKFFDLSPQLVTCRGQAIWYLPHIETICSRYRVSKKPD